MNNTYTIYNTCYDRLFMICIELTYTVRNLRIREDTAKYLRNLNTDSAYYDPKTRSMRDNPNPQLRYVR